MFGQVDVIPIKFKIHYKTEHGQTLSVVGSVDQIGKWKDLKVGEMKWSAGDHWTTTIDLPRVFQYKYVVVHGSQAIRWEQGPNRICDFSKLLVQPELGDEWEHFTVTFSIYYPLQSQTQVMRINGDTEKLGSWNKGSGAITMQKGEAVTWLTGEKVKPWVMERVRFSSVTFPQRLIYKYSLKNEDTIVWEREPSRVLQIRDPSEYTPGMYTGVWRNCDQVFLVNGHIEKADANFVAGMLFDEIGDTNIILGPYPQVEEDILKLVGAGATGVLNVQTEIDHAHRSVNWEKFVDFYKQNGVKAVHFPIHDFNEEDLTNKLYQAALTLKSLLDEGRKTYVHCTAGMGRAPAVVLVYLCLFQGMDPIQADLFVKSHRKVSVPNMRAVTNVVGKYVIV